MKISLKALKYYVEINVPVEELCDRMVMAGFEVESIEIRDKQIVSLSIKNLRTGVTCYRWSKGDVAPIPTPERKKEDNFFRCEKCNEVLKPYIGKKGNEIGVRRHAEESKAKFNGKVYCIDCINEAMKAKDDNA